MWTFVVGDIKTYGTGTPPATLAQPTLDGAAWDITGGSAILWFRRPDGSVFSKVGTITSMIPRYLDSPSSLSQPGRWKRWWTLTDAAGITESITPIEFDVAATR